MPHGQYGHSEEKKQLALPGIEPAPSSPRSPSLYRLSYPARTTQSGHN
jgi:hypothetical protein